MTAFNIIKSLVNKGNNVIGAGCYAAALSSTNQFKVIKVGSRCTDPWLDYYYEIVATNKHSVHVPKVDSVYVDESHNYYIVVMEKLQMHQDYYVGRDIASLCEDYTKQLITVQEFVAKAANYTTEIPDAYALAQLLDQIYNFTDHLTFSYDPSQRDGRELDMHLGNFMYRDGVLVVTDPWKIPNDEDFIDVSYWVDSVIDKKLM